MQWRLQSVLNSTVAPVGGDSEGRRAPQLMMVVPVCGGPTGAVVRLGARAGEEEHATKTAERSRQMKNNCFVLAPRNRAGIMMHPPCQWTRLRFPTFKWGLHARSSSHYVVPVHPCFQKAGDTATIL